MYWGRGCGFQRGDREIPCTSSIREEAFLQHLMMLDAPLIVSEKDDMSWLLMGGGTMRLD